MNNYETNIEKYIDWSNFKDDVYIHQDYIINSFYDYSHREFMNCIPKSIYQPIKHKLKNITFWDKEISVGI